MREPGFFKIFEEIIFPFVLYALFSWFMLREAVAAIKGIKRFKREGCKVPAKIVDYYEMKCSNSSFSYWSYNVTVECKPPYSDEEETYYLYTTSRRAKRYEKLKETDVVFLNREERRPVLAEELRSIKRVRFTAMFGGIFCTLFCTVILIAVLDEFTGGVIVHFLHKLFF